MANNTGPLRDKDILQLVEVLRPVPERKPSNVAEGRARFIKEARDLKIRSSNPVSVSLLTSLKVWMDKFTHPFKTIKENTMIMKFSAIVLVITMIFGGASTAVHAAGGSLPGQPMYPLKIMAEEMQGAIASPGERVEQSLQRVETRIQEILRLRLEDKPVPETAFNRLENQVEQTLRLMLRLKDGEFIQEMAQVRTRFMEQERALAGLEGQQNGDAVLLRLRTMLQERLQLLGDGSEDSEQIRLQIKEREQLSRPTGTVTQPTNGQGTGPGPANQKPAGTCTPVQDGTGPGPGPFGSGTGTPAGGGTGSGPGPEAGPGPAVTVTPGNGTGSGSEKTPTPGSGPGSGPGAGQATPSGTPVQDGTGPGPGPGTGNPTGTCTPVQDGTGPGPGPGGGSMPTPGGSGGGGKP